MNKRQIQDSFAGYKFEDVIRMDEEEKRRNKDKGRENKGEQPKDSPISITEHENYYQLQSIDERAVYYEVEIRKTPLGAKTLEGHASATNDVRGTSAHSAASIATFYKIISTLYNNKDNTITQVKPTELRDYIVQNILTRTIGISLLTEIMIESTLGVTEQKLTDCITQECGTPDLYRTPEITIDNIKTRITPKDIEKMSTEEKERITRCVQVMLSTQDNITKINEVFKWFTKKPLYISTPQRQEKIIMRGTIGIRLNVNACNFTYQLNNEESPAIGVRIIKQEGKQ